MSDDRLLSTASAARYLDLHPATLRKWRVAGTGPRWVVLGNGFSIRYRLSDLESWVQGVAA